MTTSALFEYRQRRAARATEHARLARLDARVSYARLAAIAAFALTLWLVLGAGGVFEFPLIIVLLVWLGIMTTAFLRKYRRHAIVVIFIISAIVTPTPDPLTQTLFAGPLYALYEISILVSTRVEKKRAAKLV